MGFAYKITPDERVERRLHERPARLGRVAEYFVAFEIACQLALLLPVFAAERSLIRTSAFGASLVMLGVAGTRRGRHPSSRAALLVLSIVAISVLNPMRNSWLSAIAQVVLYAAILAPLFWVPGLKLDSRAWYRVLLILWIFHSVSAAVGILQVYFPGTFQPNLSSVLAGRDWDYLKSLMITTNTGERVFRPMGLTDSPGGAAGAGLYAVSLGLLLFVLERRTWWRVVQAASMAVGLAVIALSQVRTTLLMAVVCVLAFFVLLKIRNLRVSRRKTLFGERITKVNITLAVAAICGMLVLGSVLALSLANKSVSDRVATFFSEDPSQVYYANRGHFIEHTINDLLPEFPLGAGPGRWGMMFSYFGDPSNLDNPPVWAEVQWTGWLLDGGVPLILAYVFLLAQTFIFAFKTALARNATELGTFGAFVFAYNLAALAQTFDSPFFISQAGMEFWFMNAMLYSAALEWRRRGSRRVRD
jgi:hypothetical protein